MQHGPNTTYNNPFNAESVDMEDSLKAGQVVEPMRDTQDCAITVGALRAANAQNKTVLLDGHVLLRRGLLIDGGCTFIALQRDQRCRTDTTDGTASPFNQPLCQTTRVRTGVLQKRIQRPRLSPLAPVGRNGGGRIERKLSGEESGRQTGKASMCSVMLGRSPNSN